MLQWHWHGGAFVLFCFVMFCVRQLFIPISLVVYSQFSMKITTGFYVNISLSSTVPGVWNWLWTCTSLIHTQFVVRHGFVWKGKQFTDAQNEYVEILLDVHMQRSKHTPNASYF